MKVDETFNLVDKKDKMMGLDEKWTYGIVHAGNYEKDDNKVEVFVNIRTSAQMHGLKQQVTNTCEDETVWIKQTNSELEHVKIIGVLIGFLMPYSSLE